ncbi:hypothetical protein BSLG_007542 [Batrachochytrium salamandrivorans]|nr:hypothetical protein BASA81_005726 [Batrachochytrium salamandrivorans]KAJ1334387.1 hypothetical protein BSLG_007542 [Batrachochytrium salamandrivorans]
MASMDERLATFDTWDESAGLSEIGTTDVPSSHVDSSLVLDARSKRGKAHASSGKSTSDSTKSKASTVVAAAFKALTSVVLAQQGLLHTPHRDDPLQLTCSECKKIISGYSWQTPLLMSLTLADVESKAGAGITDKVVAAYSKRDLLPKTPIEAHLEEYSDCNAAVIWVSSLQLSSSHCNKKSPEPFIHPHGSAMIAARLDTFEKSWPYQGKKGSTSELVPMKMASAGFIYFPTLDSNDSVLCPYCHISLDGWEPHDSPTNEHRRRKPTCLFFQYADTKRTTTDCKVAPSRKPKTAAKNLDGAASTGVIINEKKNLNVAAGAAALESSGDISMEIADSTHSTKSHSSIAQALPVVSRTDNDLQEDSLVSNVPFNSLKSTTTSGRSRSQRMVKAVKESASALNKVSKVDVSLSLAMIDDEENITPRKSAQGIIHDLTVTNGSKRVPRESIAVERTVGDDVDTPPVAITTKSLRTRKKPTVIEETLLSPQSSSLRKSKVTVEIRPRLSNPQAEVPSLSLPKKATERKPRKDEAAFQRRRAVQQIADECMDLPVGEFLARMRGLSLEWAQETQRRQMLQLLALSLRYK